MTAAWLPKPRQKCIFCSAIKTVAPVPRNCRNNSISGWPRRFATSLLSRRTVRWWSKVWPAMSLAVLSTPTPKRFWIRFPAALSPGNTRHRCSHEHGIQDAQGSSNFPRVAPPVDHQHQGREPAQQPVRDDRHRIRERQRQIGFRNTTCRFGKFITESNRKRDRATVAAGPAIGVGPEAMNSGKEIRGHSDIAVPDVIEFDRPNLRPQPLQALRDNDLEPLRLVARADHGSAGLKAIARVVARKVKFAVGIGHGLPARNDGLPR